MSVLCGVDFSQSSTNAAEIAAGIASRWQVPLHLVHALGEWPVTVYEGERGGLLTSTRRALGKQAQALHGTEASIGIHALLEQPESALLRLASEESATLLVFGATGGAQGVGEPIGRTADRLAQHSKVPSLVIRDVEPFRRWLRGQKPLRVVVGVDFSVVSDDAWRWVNELRRVGPVEVIGAHSFWPTHEYGRLGLGGLRSYVDPDPEVVTVLRRELEERFPESVGSPRRFRIEPSLGRPADHLVSIASAEKADLVVVGSHQRSAIARLWEGSVSRGVLHHATASVACVPLAGGKGARAGSEVRSVLAATDLTRVGNVAVEYAYAQVGRGGRVYLAHVIKPSGASGETDIFKVSPGGANAKKDAEDRLRSLVPMRAVIDDKSTEVVVLESSSVASAIAQAAERLAVDVICLGTHAHGTVANAVLGSVAQAVLRSTERPVLLVRPPKE